MVMIFAGGHVGGAHYNPAVTLSIWIRGMCNGVEAAFYVVAQVIGAVAATIVVPMLFGHTVTAGATGSTVQTYWLNFLARSLWCIQCSMWRRLRPRRGIPFMGLRLVLRFSCKRWLSAQSLVAHLIRP